MKEEREREKEREREREEINHITKFFTKIVYIKIKIKQKIHVYILTRVNIKKSGQKIYLDLK